MTLPDSYLNVHLREIQSYLVYDLYEVSIILESHAGLLIIFTVSFFTQV